MRNGLKFMGLAAVAALSLTAGAIQDALGVVLKHAPKVGGSTKFRMKSDMDAQGQAMVFSALFTEKVTKIADNGDFTVEAKMSDAKVDMGGNVMDLGDQAGGTTTTTYKTNGEVLTVASDQADANTYRMANMQSLRFPSTALKVGDSWPIDIKKDDKGSAEAKGTAKVEAREMVGKHDTLRIHISVKETAAQDPFSSEGTVWIDVKDADLVKADVVWTNAPIPQMGPMTMKVKMTREE